MFSCVRPVVGEAGGPCVRALSPGDGVRRRLTRSTGALDRALLLLEVDHERRERGLGVEVPDGI